jgi:hypothetical protein
MIGHITENWDKYLEVVFALLGLFSIIARITPNQKDNAIADWLLKRINNLGLRGGAAG